jgi:hypothetical protein
MNPVFLVDNLLNAESQYRGHTVAGEEEPVGNEAWRVADGRRSRGDYWTPTTANSDTYVEVDCDRVRGADTLVLDANLAGYDIELRGSCDDWTTYESVLDLTIPSVSAPGALDSALGVLTEDGVWAIAFDLRAYAYWRIFVDAMGAGLKPQIYGAWLGKSYQPDYFNLPWAEEPDELLFGEVVSEAGWRGTTKATQRRGGQITLQLSDYAEYELARFHLQSLYGSGQPMWIFFDDQQADRGVLAERPQGDLGFRFGPDWAYRQAQINWVEREPRGDVV